MLKRLKARRESWLLACGWTHCDQWWIAPRSHGPGDPKAVCHTLARALVAAGYQYDEEADLQ
jgi:hypothetical protein